MPNDNDRGYPRPQLCRPGWQPLNGEWEFALDPQARWDHPDQVNWSARIYRFGRLPYRSPYAAAPLADRT